MCLGLYRTTIELTKDKISSVEKRIQQLGSKDLAGVDQIKVEAS
jgi:hypothetical protein